MRIIISARLPIVIFALFLSVLAQLVMSTSPGKGKSVNLKELLEGEGGRGE